MRDDPAPEPRGALRRRDFLKAAAIGSAAAGALAAAAPAVAAPAAVKIERVEVFPVRYSTAGHFKFLSGPRGPQGRAAVIVKIVASDGTAGWGQSVPIPRWSYETLETAAIALREYFAPVLLGRDPEDIAGIHAAMDQEIAPSFSTGMPIARAGIDVALWDLTGRLRKQGIAELWGKKPGGRLELSWTVNARTLDEVEGIVAEGQQRGYRHFNIKVAPDAGFDVELARRVRKLAPAGFLWADANGGYDLEPALAAAPKLAGAGVDVLEAPLRPNRLRGYQALVRQNALPVLMDEGVVSAVELEEFIALKMLHGAAMKPSRCGGLTSCKRQIEVIEQHGLMWLGSGLTDPDLSLAASLILYAAFGLERPAALNGPQFLTESVLRHPLVVKDGHAEVPAGHGLGIEVDEGKVREMAERCRG